VILDGVGIGARDESDGVHLAHTPVLDRLFIEDSFTQLKAHGVAVGMPSDDDMGNSEVGHNTLGAGRVFAQGAKLVQEAVTDGRIFKSEAWNAIVTRARDGGTVHFIGLLSDGNVHSHIKHLLAMLDECAKEGVKRVRVHALVDGRDVGERSALKYAGQLEEKLTELRNADRDYRVASGGGRMNVTMDRYFADWSIVERGWKAHVLGDARGFSSLEEAIKTYYDEDPHMTDQYLDSFVIEEKGQPVGTIEDGDSVVFFNFRGDRALEMTMAFEEPDFNYFDRVRCPKVYYAGMMEYDGDTHRPRHYLVEPPNIDRCMSEYLCAEGVMSYAISETQKYGHVTYFWNGNNSGYIDEKLEKYAEVPSDRVPFDQRPWMKAAEITDETIKAIESGYYKFIRLNYPNGDMVGHTGVPAAIRISVEAVDLCLARLLRALERAQGVAVLLADHGNADLMFTEKKGKREPMVAHTLNPVPFIVKDFSKSHQFHLKPESKHTPRGLSRVAATLMNLLGYEAPDDYDPSLVELRT
jgi:2,3-bisphosphoglycerate-independent phosphoglycerate mutase